MVERNDVGPKGAWFGEYTWVQCQNGRQSDESGGQILFCTIEGTSQGSVTYLGKQTVHLAAGTVCMFAQPRIVPIPEKIVSHQRVMDETLKDDVEETCLSKIEETTTTLALVEHLSH